jgi:hypothetical protein
MRRLRRILVVAYYSLSDKEEAENVALSCGAVEHISIMMTAMMMMMMMMSAALKLDVCMDGY